MRLYIYNFGGLRVTYSQSVIISIGIIIMLFIIPKTNANSISNCPVVDYFVVEKKEELDNFLETVSKAKENMRTSESRRIDPIAILHGKVIDVIDMPEHKMEKVIPSSYRSEPIDFLNPTVIVVEAVEIFKGRKKYYLVELQGPSICYYYDQNGIEIDKEYLFFLGRISEDSLMHNVNSYYSLDDELIGILRQKFGPF